MPVQLARVRTEDITSKVRAPGKIEPKTQVKISADIMGKVTHLAVKEGDRVKKGQLLLQIDPVQRSADQVQARTGLESAKARQRDAEGKFKVAQSNFQRQKALYEQKLLSNAEWDQATSTYEAAREAANGAREDVARSQAALTAASDNLSKTRSSLRSTAWSALSTSRKARS
jgi:HlyD family secretion protein